MVGRIWWNLWCVRIVAFDSVRLRCCPSISSSGGFVVDFPLDANSSAVLLNNVTADGYIDRSTRYTQNDEPVWGERGHLMFTYFSTLSELYSWRSMSTMETWIVLESVNLLSNNDLKGKKQQVDGEFISFIVSILFIQWCLGTGIQDHRCATF
jgi:hypothetical protein